MKEAPTAATVLMSGGIDSTACAHFIHSRGLAVDGLFINYGQAAAKEEAIAVKAISEQLRINVRTADLSGSRDRGPGELVGRNALLVFTALFLNEGRSSILGLGVHSGTPYYDCSEEFASTINRFVAEHTDGQVSVLAPFVTWTKSDVFDYFTSTGINLATTYSCEAGTMPTCGVCASCRDRKVLGC